VLSADLWALYQADLLDAISLNYVYGNRFVISSEGYAHYAALKERAAAPAERVEDHTRRLLESDAFRESFPAAFERWADAEALLWRSNSEREWTTIGFKAREATQLFATALVAEHDPADVDPDVTRTKNRLRSVIGLYREKLGSSRGAMLDALLAHWDATVDVIQRQTHGQEKGNEPLTWLDAWRVVLHTAVLMHEIAATLEEMREPPQVAHLESGR
jgi:hypothetical protein